MKELAMSAISIGFLVWFVAAGFDQCSRREGFAGQGSWSGSTPSAAVGRNVPSRAVVALAVRPASRAARLVTGDAPRLITAVGSEFDVPAGALYGIWKVESSGLSGGWGQGKGWLSAAALSEPGSECYKHYVASRCEGWWLSLQAICGQQRGGVRICDPDQVRTSYAFAMGPMQHLPSLFAPRRPDGSYRLGDHAVDYDGDGAADPHQLGDALASTAKLLRKYFEEEGSWQRAINRYYGSQTEGYYEGHDDRKGVFHHWSEWCASHGPCRNGSVSYVSK